MAVLQHRRDRVLREPIIHRERLKPHVTRLRMRNARELLKTTPLRVPDIGERVGYQSELSFVKAFKKLHGMTPRAFRLSPDTG